MAKRVVGKCAHDSVFVKDIDWQKDLSWLVDYNNWSKWVNLNIIVS
jgi:hypothetical protein